MGQAEGRPYEMAISRPFQGHFKAISRAISYGRPSACPILLAALSATLLPSGSYRKMTLYKISGLWVMLFIGSSQNGGLLHGYKLLFEGFSGFLNWLSERCTGALLWDFLFILGRSIDWHTD